MSYKATIISKILKRLRQADRGKQLAVRKPNKFSEHVGKWLATEGRNFITMATL